MVSFYGPNSFYGTATYSNPIYISLEKAGLSFETVARAFTGDSGVIRILTITASDPLSADALSGVSADYLLEQVKYVPALSEFTVFSAGAIIDAVAMNQNFTILAQTVEPGSTTEELTIPEMLSFSDTAASLSARADQGLHIGYQAKQKSETQPQAFRRPLANRETESTVLRLRDGNVSVLGGTAERGEQTVNLDRVVVWGDGLMWLTAPIRGGSESQRRLLFRALTTPVMVTGISKKLTTVQEIEIPQLNRAYDALEVSVRLGTTSANAMSIQIYGKGDPEEMGYTVDLPAVANHTGERFVTKRIRVPVTNGRLMVKLSNQCTTVEIRVLGTWR